MLLIISLWLTLSPAYATFIPDNVVRTKALPQGPANMDEPEFRRILANVETIYAPIVRSLGGQLALNGDWRNEQLNAGAQQVFGRWMVMITGGLARRPELTPDGFTLIVCHELGHHLGGFAFSRPQVPLIPVWAANEGQADYFSTHVCARRLWSADLTTNSTFRQTASATIRQMCDAQYVTSTEQDLCYRILAASESMTLTMATLMEVAPPKFETPDPAVVAETDSAHPKVQCRMDTVLQGALCKVAFRDDLIPGKSQRDLFGMDAEREAAMTSCTALTQSSAGLRPACWFKARL